jgi:hypothetical protein
LTEIVPPALLAHVFNDHGFPAYAITGMEIASMAIAVSFLNMGVAPFECAFNT